MAKRQNEKITENEHVKEFLAILKAYNSPSLNDFNAMLNHVSAMEKQLDEAVKELAAMRSYLTESEKHNYPFKNTMQKAVIIMQAQVLELRDKVTKLKEFIIDGCKKAVAAFKEKGVAALNNIARFFKVKSFLIGLYASANKAVQSANKTISNIEAVSKRYHKAQMHIKNAGRALTGKKAVQKMKPLGKMAKTFSAPFRATRFCFTDIKNNAAAAVVTLNQLEKQAAKQKKPSIKKTMQKFNKQIEHKKQKTLNKTRSKPSTEL